jgi:hypothetical protein
MADPSLPEKFDAAAGPLRRLSAVAAQLSLARIPADAMCCCLCSVYEPHACEGWRAEGLEREVPADKVFGWRPPPVRVPVCRSCHGVPLREA